MFFHRIRSTARYIAVTSVYPESSALTSPKHYSLKPAHYLFSWGGIWVPERGRRYQSGISMTAQMTSQADIWCYVPFRARLSALMSGRSCSRILISKYDDRPLWTALYSMLRTLFISMPPWAGRLYSPGKCAVDVYCFYKGSEKGVHSTLFRWITEKNFFRFQKRHFLGWGSAWDDTYALPEKLRIYAKMRSR